jgi:hypothetical protein
VVVEGTVSVPYSGKFRHGRSVDLEGESFFWSGSGGLAVKVAEGSLGDGDQSLSPLPIARRDSKGATQGV